jgi:hypothetical protein
MKALCPDSPTCRGLAVLGGTLVRPLWGSDDWRLAEVGAITEEEFGRRTAPRLGLSTFETLAELTAALFGDLHFDPELVRLARWLRARYRTAMLSFAGEDPA